MTFPDFLQSLGIIPPRDITPGKWHRTATVTHPKKKNANVKLCEDGTHGFAIDFSSMTESALWTSHGLENIGRERTAEENAELSRKLAAKRAEERAGIARANALYGTARALMRGEHEYIQRKNLDMCGAHGLRVDDKGWLLVRMMRDGKIISVQRISPEGEKKFMYGCPTKWTQYRICRPGSVVTVLVEGLATGITVFQAMGNADVIVCFSAANLVAVAEREEWEGMVAVAGDNDHWTQEIYGKNPGADAAKKAADIIGCGYALPTCEGTDFNDMFSERLTALQKADESSNYPAHPAKLRQSALAPIRGEIMKAMRLVKK